MNGTQIYALIVGILYFIKVACVDVCNYTNNWNSDLVMALHIIITSLVLIALGLFVFV